MHSGDKIALIKRSDRVGTYRGSRAAFSGYVERLPLNQAWQELEEEAGITRNDARLRGIGVPLPVDDNVEDSHWLVFPFLFQLVDDVEIKTDWETEEWGWFKPGEMANLKTVPSLDKALDRVWPPFGDHEFWDGLAAVATDTTHGATELARRGLRTLGSYIQANYDDIGREELLRAVRAFAASRPVMGVFPDLAARLLLAAQREGGQIDFDTLISELLSAVEDATDLSANTAAEALKGAKRLFTLSYSEAVRDTIISWHTGELGVVIAESGPRNEGLRLAEYLSDQGIFVETVADADIPAAVGTADAVIVGCDAIIQADELMNKIGTRAAVDAANEEGIPAYAVAQTYKVMPPQWPVFIERQAPADYEASQEKTGGPIFDLTAFDDFEAVFAEEGILTPQSLREIRDELASVELIPTA